MHGASNNGRSRHEYATLSDAELIAALRRVETFAIEEFIRRFQPGLLMQARRARITPGDRQTWVLEVLHDVALRVTQTQDSLARPLVAYVTRALHNKIALEFREAARRAKRNTAAEQSFGSTGERAVSESVSTYSVRVSHGPGWEEARLSPLLERLASALDDGLTVEERQILNWASAFIPHRQIAEWLGITRDAASQRLSRLTRRLRDAARRFGEGELDVEERSELQRFFRRVLTGHCLLDVAHDTDEDRGNA